MNSDWILRGTVVFLACMFAAYSDLRSFRIPNSLTYTLLVSGIVYHGINGGLPGLQASFLGAFFGFAVFFVVYLLGGMGGGDIKLLAAIGAWLGIFATSIIVLIAAVVSCGYSLLYLVRRLGWSRSCTALKAPFHKAYSLGKHLCTEQRMNSAIADKSEREGVIPFGIMIGIGAAMFLMGVVFGWIG